MAQVPFSHNILRAIWHGVASEEFRWLPYGRGGGSPWEQSKAFRASLHPQLNRVWARGNCLVCWHWSLFLVQVPKLAHHQPSPVFRIPSDVLNLDLLLEAIH